MEAEGPASVNLDPEISYRGKEYSYTDRRLLILMSFREIAEDLTSTELKEKVDLKGADLIIKDQEIGKSYNPDTPIRHYGIKDKEKTQIIIAHLKQRETDD